MRGELEGLHVYPGTIQRRILGKVRSGNKSPYSFFFSFRSDIVTGTITDHLHERNDIMTRHLLL